MTELVRGTRVTPDDFSAALPPVLAEIAASISVECALKLAEAFGGTHVYVPSRPRSESRITKCIGIEAARRLARNWGGDTIEMPLARVHTRERRNADIRLMRQQGASESTVARHFGMTARGVRRITNGALGRQRRSGWGVGV